MISVVIASWRARFMMRLRVRISSSALSLAAAMARCWAVKKEAAPSEQGGEDLGLDRTRAELAEQRLDVRLELGVPGPGRLGAGASPSASSGAGSGSSWCSSTDWRPEEWKRVDTSSTWSASPEVNGAATAAATRRASAKSGRSLMPVKDCSTS